MSESEYSPYISATVGGKEIQFRKLTPWDRLAILAARKKQQRESLLADLKAVGADKAEMLGELRAFDERESSEADFLVHFDSPQGKVDIFEIALRELPEAERAQVKEQMALSQRETVELAAKLCNIKLPEPKAEEGDDPNPNSPAPMGQEPDSYNSPATSPTT